MKPYHYVMADIETLGTAPTSAPIIELAAVPFDPTQDDERIHIDDAFYTEISYEDNLKHGRLPSTDTAIWWLHQERSIHHILRSPVTVHTAVEKFAYWCQEYTDKDTQWYCQGTNFDPLILEDFFQMLLMPTPWKYAQWNDCRTLQKFYGLAKPKVQHHPVDDCIDQIRVLRSAFIQRDFPQQRGARLSTESFGNPAGESVTIIPAPITIMPPLGHFRAGDIIRHTPPGEEWALAVDEDHGTVIASGSLCAGRGSDCILLKPSTDEERLAMLQSWATSTEVQDPRTLTARRQLQQQ